VNTARCDDHRRRINVKRAAAIPLALATVAVVAAIVSATGLAGPGGAQDSVYGGGRHAGAGACTDGTTPFCPPAREFSLDAHSNRNGANASGTLEYANAESGAVIVSGDVTCLNADGDQAVVGGRLNEGENAGTGFVLYLEDRGRPGSATRDRVSPVFVFVDTPEPPGFPRTCPEFEENVGGVGFFLQTFGDVAVVDE
jgi:hypothetical protein